MRPIWLIILIALTACTSSDPAPRQGQKAHFEAVVQQVAGRDATDCGTTGPRFPSNAVRQCAATKLTSREPFFAIRYEQGIDSDTGAGWVLDSAGHFFLVGYDEVGCRTLECSVHLAQCGKLEIVKDWDWFRAGDCEERTLPQPLESSGNSASPVSPH